MNEGDAKLYEDVVASVLRPAAKDPLDEGLRSLVDKVRACFPWQEAMCRRHCLSGGGSSFYEVGRWIDGTTQFKSLTPLWASREAAWTDAVERLGR